MSQLQVDSVGRVISPDGSISITYAEPWPSANGTPGGFEAPARGMVFHTEVGWEHTVEEEFADSGYQASAFFSVSGGLNAQSPPDGNIHQYGPLTGGWMAWTQAGGNPKWRGVEFEDGGDPTRPLTPAQLSSGGHLLEVLSRLDHFPIQATDDPNGGTGLILHVDGGAAWGGHDCPGSLRAGQRPTLIGIAQSVGGTSTTLTPGGPVSSDFPNAAVTLVTPSGNGTTVVGADGGIFCTGDAGFYGSLPQLKVTPSAPIVDAAYSWDGKGYYLLGADGGVFNFGSAKLFGLAGEPSAVSYPALPAADRQGNRSFGARGFNLHWGGTGYTLVALDGSRYSFGS